MNASVMYPMAEMFVIFEESDVRTRQAVLLNSLGLPFVEVDAGPSPLAGDWRLGHGAAHLVIPAGLNFMLLLRQLRSSFPDSIILAVGDFADTARRIHAYMAGADNCLCADAGPEELAVILQGIRRKRPADFHGEAQASDDAFKLPQAQEGRQGVWELSDEGWILACADGSRLDLRKSERTLLQSFAHRDGMEIRRSETISGGDGSSITGRSIDVVISRLKRRAQQQGVKLPIRSVRGRGYVFAGKLRVGMGRRALAESPQLLR